MAPFSVQDCLRDVSLRELFPAGLSTGELQELDKLGITRQRVKHRGYLFRAGDQFKFLYMPRVGFFKTELLFDGGRGQVIGFHMAGELMGLDAIDTERHGCDAIALEDSEVCVVPFGRLEHVSREMKALQHHFHRVMSREIVREHGVMMLLGSMRAEERLAAFLLDLSQRLGVRGYAQNEFHLRMTREEIGSYLGLELETVSRAFSKFQGDGLLAVQHKHVRILQLGKLREIVSRYTC